MEQLFLFIVAHAVCDFVLQGEAMGSGKNRRREMAAVRGPGFPPWYYWLGAHGITHGGAVYLISGLWPLGALEAAIHVAIDFMKCEGRLSFNQDQGLHLVCKLAYVAILA